MKKCTCGDDGEHAHNIDGQNYSLCGHCHAVIHVIKRNTLAINIIGAIVTAVKDDKGLTYFDKIAAIKPEPMVVKAEQLREAIANQPEEVFIGSETDIRPFYIPIKDNDNEVLREPFSIPQ